MSENDTERQGDGWEGSIGGNCPVQGEGKVDGLPWYFRSRGAHWSFEVSLLPNGDPVSVSFKGGDPGFELVREYGEWPSAGWIEDEEAWAFIEIGIREFRTWLLTLPTEVITELPLGAAMHIQDLQRKAGEAIKGAVG